MKTFLFLADLLLVVGLCVVGIVLLGFFFASMCCK